MALKDFILFRIKQLFFGNYKIHGEILYKYKKYNYNSIFNLCHFIKIKKFNKISKISFCVFLTFSIFIP